MLTQRSVSVFCGSSSGNNPAHTAAARLLGHVIADNKLALFYGGGQTGLMGAIAEGCLLRGGEVTGVIPCEVSGQEVPHPDVSDIVWVNTIDERKHKLLSLGDMMIVLPGGFGTMEELFCLLARSRIGLHSKPIGLLDSESYFSGLMCFLDHATQEGFIKAKHKAGLVISDAPQFLVTSLLERL